MLANNDGVGVVPMGGGGGAIEFLKSYLGKQWKYVSSLRFKYRPR